MNELWKPIKHYEVYYEISSLGRLRSVDRVTSHGHRRKSQLIICRIDKTGYVRVCLYHDGQKNMSIHRLVAEAFIPNQINLPQVNHKDGNKSNNRVSNLEWTDTSTNFQHAITNGLVKNIGEDSHRAKLTLKDVRTIRQRLAQGEGNYIIARDFGVSGNCIYCIATQKSWKHII